MSEKRWNPKSCKEYVESTGKCRIKVHYRYNDYCEKDDCPKHKAKTAIAAAEKL